ncbi:MAG: phosphotransferase [Microbacterium sp.]|uniref:phosphotransferase n=1 Tax=Microbacterium sp. TaxID=51671 RepID=UPI0039E4C3F4
MASTGDGDAALVADALDVSPAALRVLGREPLGDGSVAGFEVTDGDSAGMVAYADTSGLRVPAETGFARDDGARVWMHPADPHVPALAPVAYEGAAAALLERLGLRGLRAVEMVGYRPGRRAVLRADLEEDGAARTVWLKTVRPARVERIVTAHRAMSAAALPTPDVLGWSPDGLIVLSSAVGTPATDAVWSAGALLDAVDRLRKAFDRVELAIEARTSLSSRLDWYTERLRAALAGAGDRVDAVAAAATAVLGRTSAERAVVHGDLHLGQLFLDTAGDEVRITGLVDVDTAGLGDPADDAAAFLGHVVASAVATEPDAAAARVWGLANAAGARWGGDPRVLALTRVHLLGHALTAAELGDAASANRLVAIAADLPDGAVGPWDLRKTGLITAFEGS